jgi:hypothetical protein
MMNIHVLVFFVVIALNAFATADHVIPTHVIRLRKVPRSSRRLRSNGLQNPKHVEIAIINAMDSSGEVIPCLCRFLWCQVDERHPKNYGSAYHNATDTPQLSLLSP